MTPARGRARGARRRLVAATVTLLLAALGLAGAVAGARPAAAADPHQAAIVVTGLTPLVPTAGRTLTVSGTVRDTAPDRMRDVEVRLRVSRSALDSRTELGAVASGQTTSRDGRVVTSESLPDIPAGGQAAWSVAVPLDDVFRGSDFGVYVLSIEVRATLPSGFGRVGIVRTFLPWVPAHHTFSPTGLAWVWPVEDRPHREVGGTFSDDDLGVLLDRDGRLGRLVAQGARLSRQVPVTWMVDPDLLDSAQDMTASYQVRLASGGTAPGTGSAQATTWLAAVRSATAQSDVVALPYADPDLVAVQRAGLSADVVTARRLGDQVASQLLGRAVSSEVAWPAGGQSNPATLSMLAAQGESSVILSSGALPPSLDLPYTPTGRADVSTAGGSLHALLADDGLDAILARTDDPEGPVLQVQRFLAETAMVTDQLPSRSRTLLVTPPRGWDPSELMVGRLVDAVTVAPWLTGTSLDALAATAPPEIDRSPLRYPAIAAAAELPRSYLQDVGRVGASLTTFGQILTAPDLLVPPFQHGVLRLESQGWRRDPRRTTALIRTSAALRAAESRVRVLGGSYTFGSKTGTIPLTIDNELSQPVVVQVSMHSETPRLKVRSIGPVRLEPNRKTQIVLPATVRANGRVVVTAQLLTPQGQPYGRPAHLAVHITRYGTLALLFTGGAVALLMGVAGLRTLRRIRRRGGGRRPPADPGPDDPGDPGGRRAEEQTVG